MEQLDIPYSHKNIPIPGQREYLLNLTQKIEHLIVRMRWKAYLFLSNTTQNKKEN